MSHTAYYPEMTEVADRPTGEIHAHIGHYGKHWFLRTPLTLSGRGVTFLDSYTESNSVAGSRYLGWNKYKVTEAAFERLCEQYNVVTEMML